MAEHPPRRAQKTAKIEDRATAPRYPVPPGRGILLPEQAIVVGP
jgi:hypothetical protein